MIEQLTENQLALLTHYQAKWSQIARSTDRINLEEATAAIALAYRQLERPTPKILFFPSPTAASNSLDAKRTRHRWGTRWLRRVSDFVSGVVFITIFLDVILIFPFFVIYGLKLLPEMVMSAIATFIGVSTILMILLLPIMLVLERFTKIVERLELRWNQFQIDRRWGALLPELDQQWSAILQPQLVAQLSTSVWHQVRGSEPIEIAALCDLIERSHPESFQLPSRQANLAAAYDFCVSLLHCNDSNLGHTLIELIQHCSFILPFEQVCLVCDRPIKLSVDADDQFHAEGEPAIKFVDRSRWYFYHSIQLPQKYGSVVPQQWQPEWVLSEHNPDLKEMLVQTIGYAKLCEQLAIVLDAEDGDTLFKIDRFISYEYDGFEALHVLRLSFDGEFEWWRVPATIETVQAAILWLDVNDFDEFF